LILRPGFGRGSIFPWDSTVTFLPARLYLRLADWREQFRWENHISNNVPQRA
jgi:hypothetical protein